MWLSCYYCDHKVRDLSTRKLMKHLRDVHRIGFKGIKDVMVNIVISFPINNIIVIRDIESRLRVYCYEIKMLYGSQTQL